MAASNVVDVLERRYETYSSAKPAAPFAVRLNGSSAQRVGQGEPAFTIRVVDPRGMRALAELDQFGVAVAYLQGWLDVDGDLAAALRMRDFFTDFHPLAWIGRFTPALLRGGRLADDSRTIGHHYDEDPDFFLTFLDRRHRLYSEGIFVADDEPLEEAATRKLQTAFDALGVGPGDHVLDVGGGWGSFAEFAARRGVNVTTLTLSRPGARYMADLAKRDGLPMRVRYQHLFDFVPDRRYDGIVNLGATEHLPDYRTTLRRYADALRPGGRIYLDALAMRRKHMASTFLKRYVYPGASAPLLLHQYLRAVARSPFELVSIDDDRHNYHLTCAHWGRRLDDARDAIVARWGEPLYRRFRLFLWGSATGFDTGLVQAYRWVLRMPEQTGAARRSAV